MPGARTLQLIIGPPPSVITSPSGFSASSRLLSSRTSFASSHGSPLSLLPATSTFSILFVFETLVKFSRFKSMSRFSVNRENFSQSPLRSVLGEMARRRVSMDLPDLQRIRLEIGVFLAQRSPAEQASEFKRITTSTRCFFPLFRVFYLFCWLSFLPPNSKRQHVLCLCKERILVPALRQSSIVNVVCVSFPFTFLVSPKGFFQSPHLAMIRAKTQKSSQMQLLILIARSL